MPDDLESDLQATAEDIAADADVLAGDRDREGEDRPGRPARPRSRRQRRTTGARHRHEDDRGA